MKTVFGIVTIAKDNLAGLERTFESLKCVLSRHCMWFVVDGKSEDGSMHWLKVQKEKTSYLSYISEDDDGIYDAMNKGIDLARGKVDYLLFLNAGDCLADCSIFERVAGKVEATDQSVVLLVGSSLRIKTNDREYVRKPKRMRHMYYGNIGEHQAMFFHIDLLDKFRYRTQFSLSADYDLICRIGRWLDKTKASDNLLIRFKEVVCIFPEDGVSESNRLDALKQDFRIRREVLSMSFPMASILYLAHMFDYYRKKLLSWIESLWQ